ncbi:DUF6572 domain-containing protein [Streptococcus equinus]|uniref:DUF6572 domain-containing protein n=1 Tax=Streptococcus equinus TaxID=1335 RepID=UPI0008EE6851|nr:DUF6572 domain-containing protein [Streptococcus equinus]SFC49146.1 hypothetical protein SAMN05216408_0020 [Streptococcus equinus]
MTEHYLPAKESLGYKNVKTALWNVFQIDLDKIPIREGEYENFGFDLTYNSIPTKVVVAGTRKNRQFEIGEGGMVTISLPNPGYPTSAFLKTQFFHRVIKDPTIRERVEDLFGRKEEDIEFVFKVLKDYLESDESKKLLEKNVNAEEYLKLKEILDNNLSISGIDHWEIENQQLNLYVIDLGPWDKLIEQDHIRMLRIKLRDYLDFIKSKEYIEHCGTNFTKINFGVALKYTPPKAAWDFFNKTAKKLANEGISLEIILDN